MLWKKFEQFVADIFRANEFRVRQNFRFKTSKSYEIDILAIGQRYSFCVDCKQWSGGRYKKGALGIAVSNQQRRVKELKKLLKKNVIARDMLKTGRLYPLIVTQMEEDLLKEGETWVVPVEKLNSFLLNHEKYIT
jgi:Holliday junction resolvase-like predicted endonuclease